MERLLTITDVAGILGLSERRIHALCREGKLAHVQTTPRERRFLPEQLEAFIASRTVAPPKRIDRSAFPRLGFAPKTLPKGGAKSSEGLSARSLSRNRRDLKGFEPCHGSFFD